MRLAPLLLVVFLVSCSTVPAPATDPGRVAVSAALNGVHWVVHGQRVPDFAQTPKPSDFVAGDDEVVLHYYGSGGWGIEWRGAYVMTAPYFSNHSMPKLQTGAVCTPDDAEIRAGFLNTPVARTQAILVGHGHVDHAGDIPGFFGPGLIEGKPALVADVSTVNQLAPIKDKFGCITSLDPLGDNAENLARCLPPSIRVTPIHSAHAPHYDLAGLSIQAYNGVNREPLAALPSRGNDFKLGHVWAFVIDLLDAQGRIAYRIHYVDAAASMPHGFLPREQLAEHPVDAMITCLAGYDEVDDYPEDTLEYHHPKYVFAAHWEDIFTPRSWRLRPVNVIVNEKKMNYFVDRVEKVVGTTSRGGEPEPRPACSPMTCGPHTATWALPVPGETFRFKVHANTAAASATL